MSPASRGARGGWVAGRRPGLPARERPGIDRARLFGLPLPSRFLLWRRFPASLFTPAGGM